MRWIDDTLNDPKKLREAVEARIDKVVKNWPRLSRISQIHADTV
jgi:hypothetical protein